MRGARLAGVDALATIEDAMQPHRAAGQCARLNDAELLLIVGARKEAKGAPHYQYNAPELARGGESLDYLLFT